MVTLEKAEGGKRLPFETGGSPCPAQGLELWTQRNKLVLRVNQGKEEPQEVKLKRLHQHPAAGDKVHKTGKMAEKT